MISFVLHYLFGLHDAQSSGQCCDIFLLLLFSAAMSVICKKRRRKLHSDAKGIMDHEPKLYQSQFLSMDLTMNH